MKIVCVRYSCEFKPKKIGVSLLETSGEELREPHKLWSADLLARPGCNAEIVAGLGVAPVAHHNDERFNKLLEYAKKNGLYYDHERLVKG